MAIITPHESQAGIATGNAGQAAPYRSVSAFMTPGQAALPDGLNQLARGMDRLGGAVFRMGIDRMKMRNATDLLADKVAYEDALRRFDSDYRQTHQGVSARDAEEAYAAFHHAQYEKLQKKWGGNPYLMEGVNRMAAGIREPSMNRAVSFRDQQEKLYQASVQEASRAQTLQLFGDPSVPWDEKMAALEAEGNNARLFAGQRREVIDGQEQWTGGSDVTAELMALRQRLCGEHLDGLIASGNLGAASAFLGGGGKGMSGVFTGQLPPEVTKMALAEAGAQGLDPGLVMAVIAQESGGRADAVSPKGARGLMQLMPETAAELGVNADNPAQNVRGGVSYLGNMLNRYGGNVEHALMAYNWGPGNMDAWLRTGKGVNGQAMPAETRAYASGVLGRLEGGTSSLISPAARHQYRQRIDAAMRRNELAAQRASKEAEEKAADAAYAGIWESVRGLPANEQQARAAAMIGEIGNPDMRRTMLGRLKDDLAVQKLYQNAADYELSQKYREYIQAQGLLPSQAIAGVSQIQGLSDKGREQLLSELTKEAQRVTPENTAALNQLLRRIDLGKVADETRINAYAFEHGLTDKQVQEARTYRQEGGNKAGVTLTRVERVYKAMTGGGKMKPETFSLVLQNMEPGKAASDESIGRAISNLYVQSGESMGSGWFWDKDETYAAALEKGRGETWLPDVTEKERQEIRAILRRAGIEKITEERIREYKKYEIMGIPRSAGA